MLVESNQKLEGVHQFQVKEQLHHLQGCKKMEIDVHRTKLEQMVRSYARDDSEQGSFFKGGAEVDDGVPVEELEQMGRARADGETGAVDGRSVEEGAGSASSGDVVGACR